MFDLPASQLLGWSDDRPVTWGELRGRAAALSLRQRDAVIACARPFNFLAALLAVWQRGGEALIPASLQPDAIAAAGNYVLRDHDVEKRGQSNFSVTKGSSEAIDLFQENCSDPFSCQLALYTSGSTGAPKRVEKSLAQLLREVENLQALWGSTRQRVCVLATVPHYHIYGLLFRVLWPLIAGRPVDETTCADPLQLRALARKRGPYVLVSTPAHLGRFPDLLPLSDWERPALVFSSGGPLDAQSAARYRDAFGAAPYEVFGSTETGGVAWRSRDGSAQEDAWTPFPAIGVALGHDGALKLDSPYLAERDWRMDDAAELLPDGRFFLRGRLDRVVKVEGKRLSLPQLEQLLAKHAWVSAACAVALPGPQRVGVVVVPSAAGAAALRGEGQRAVREALRAHLASALEPSVLPRSYRFVEALPFDERGKLSVAALERLFHDA
jgi:acyl-coenzyme A synthetase/AMP-(fatty) acid ligase